MAKPQHVAPTPKRSSKWPWLVLFLAAAGGGGWWYYQQYMPHKMRKVEALNRMVNEARDFESSKQWDKALEAFARVEQIAPKTVHNEEAMLRIHAARNAIVVAELNAAQAAYDLKNWPMAETAVARALRNDGGNAQAKSLREAIQLAREHEEVSAATAQAHKAVQQYKWDDALRVLEAVTSKYPANAEAKALLEKTQTAKVEGEKNLIRARELAAEAKRRDRGMFDTALYALINEAKTLAPNDPEVSAVYEKISAYPRTMRVPGEIATINDAVALARPKDRIAITGGLYQEALVINKPIEIIGDGQVVLEVAGADGPVLTFGPSAQNARISGCTFRHRAAEAANGAERFPAVLVRGGAIAMRECVFTAASGHGLAVMEGGRVGLAQCRAEANGWDGISVRGEGSAVNLKNSLAVRNGEHGVDVWDGAMAALSDNICSNNRRNGVTIVSGAAQVTLTNNQMDGNREYGLVLVSAAAGQVTGNQAKSNTLGGVVVRSGAANVKLENNRLLANQGPGLLLEKGVDEAKYKANTLTGNRDKKQISAGMEFAE